MRRVLPRRRAAETFDLRFWNQSFSVTIGFYPDGSIGEIFVDVAKSGNDIANIARDAAVTLSIAIQYGTPLEAIQRAIARGAAGEPASVLGAIIDSLSTKSFPGDPR